MNGHTIYQCPSCRHQMLPPDNIKQHIATTYDDAYFFGGGAGYPDYLSERKILINQGRFYGKILRKYLDKGASVLDIGSAAGFIMLGLSENDLKVQGVEPNPTMAAYANHELGLNVQTTPLESFNTEHNFDAICLIQVIAHLCDPRQALATCLQHLRQNGLILVETWNRESLTARVCGHRWHEYSPPSVRHWFSRRGLDQLFEQLDCRKIATGRRLKMISVQHALELASHKHGKSNLSKTILSLAGLIPQYMVIPYPSEDIFWSLYIKL